MVKRSGNCFSGVMQMKKIDPNDPNKRVAFLASTDGLTVEHVVRVGQHNMKVKHFHPEYEIYYVLEGTRQFFFNNRYFTASRGDLVIIDSNMIHMTRSEPTDQGHNRIILYLTPRMLEQIDQKYLNLNIRLFMHEHYGIYHLDRAQHDQFMDLYYTLKDELQSKRKYYVQAIELSVALYLLSLKRDLNHTHTIESRNTEQYKQVYLIADYLSENYAKAISLRELSERFHLSTYYICRQFKKVTGYNIKEYINSTRTMRAKALLETTDLSILSISEAVGYESVTHFERVFKSYMNMSPLKYRKWQNLYISSTGEN